MRIEKTDRGFNVIEHPAYVGPKELASQIKALKADLATYRAAYELAYGAACSYSNVCEESGTTRRAEREIKAADDLVWEMRKRNEVTK